jgi:hypothetical protein
LITFVRGSIPFLCMWARAVSFSVVKLRAVKTGRGGEQVGK